MVRGKRHALVRPAKIAPLSTEKLNRFPHFAADFFRRSGHDRRGADRASQGHFPLGGLAEFSQIIRGGLYGIENIDPKIDEGIDERFNITAGMELNQNALLPVQIKQAPIFRNQELLNYGRAQQQALLSPQIITQAGQLNACFEIVWAIPS